MSDNERLDDNPGLCTTPSADAPPDSTLLPSTVLGSTLPSPANVAGHGVDVSGPSIPGYHLVRELGRGSMGVVYAAREERTSHLVALKTMQSTDPAFRLRFKHEFRSLALLNHPNLVSLYKLDAEGPVWFFTMELLEGVGLLEHVRGTGAWQGALSAVQLDRLRAALVQLCDGVDALHSAGIIHRDLKPSNILVTAEGRVVVLDFGLAAEVDCSGQHLSHTPRLLGTVAYMAPEQAACQPVSPASDWYSVGVILFEALTGRLPFSGRAVDILQSKMHGNAPDPAELVPGLLDDLARLCRELLARQPADRPALARAREVLGQVGPVPPGAVAASAVQQRPGEGMLLVGRHQHLRSLTQSYEGVRRGRTTVVAVHGQSGAGKSTLVRHFVDELDRQGESVVLLGRCFEQESVPYKALDSLIDALSRHLEALPHEQVEAILPRDLAALVRVFPVLRHLENGRRRSRWATDPCEPQEARRRTLAALRELLARLGDRRPLVLAIDDLQWGDEDSVAVLAELLQPPDPPLLLLVCAYRDEDVGASPCLAAFTRLAGSASAGDGVLDWVHLAVEPLPEEACRELVQTLLAEGGRPQDGGPDSTVAERVARQSGGFPFFVHELVRHLKAGEALGMGQQQADQVTLAEVLWLRARRLPESAQRLLEVVAVAGRPLGQEQACTAAGLQAGALEALALLRAERLVRGTPTPQGEQLETYHDRIRETVVRHLEAKDQIEHHRRLAQVLEAGGADPEWRAVHFLGAGDRARAGCYFSQAADRAAEALAFERAARLYRRALELRSPGEEEETARGLRIRLGAVLSQSGHAAGAAHEFQVAARGAEAALGQGLRCRAAHLLLASGHIDAGLAALQEVLASFGLSLLRNPRRAFWALVWQRLRLRLRGLHFLCRSDSEVAREDLARLDACAAAAVGLTMVDPLQAACYQSQSLLLALQAGEPDRLLRALIFEAGHESTGGTRNSRRTKQVLEAARALSHQRSEPEAQGLVFLAEGVTAAMEGDWPRARRLCDRAETIFRDSCLGFSWEQGTAHRFALWPLLYMGELAEVARRLPGLLAQARDRDDLYDETNLCLVARTYLWLAADQPARARQELAEVMARWSRQGFHVQHMNRLFDDTQIDLYEGQPRQAWQRLEANWRALRSSQLLRVQQVRIFMTALRGRAALALAAVEPDPALVRSARRDARVLWREQAPWSQALARLLDAGVASCRGKPATALLRDAADRCEATHMRLYSASARWQLARLEGAAGQHLRVQAETWMRSQQIVRPDRMAGMQVPGIPAQPKGE
jgi:hypothetical protein